MTNIANRNSGRFGAFLGWDPMRLFDELMAWEPLGSEVVWSAYRSPVSLVQDDDGATIAIDMPGVDANDLELTFDRGTLSIAGKRGERTYRHSVVLGDAIDPASIDAQLDKGVLTVRAAKRPEAKPRKILVRLDPEKALEAGETK